LTKKHRLILPALALAAAAGIASTAGASSSDAVSVVKADLAKLQGHVTARHDQMVADANKLAADAHAAKGSNRKAAKAAIRPDIIKLKADLAAARAVIHADHAQLKSDLAGLKGTKGARKELHLSLQSTRAAIHAANADARDALQKARAAVRDLRASFKK
jgi:uncharacterized protein (DUF342 family)